MLNFPKDVSPASPILAPLSTERLSTLNELAKFTSVAALDTSRLAKPSFIFALKSPVNASSAVPIFMEAFPPREALAAEFVEAVFTLPVNVSLLASPTNVTSAFPSTKPDDALMSPFMAILSFALITIDVLSLRPARRPSFPSVLPPLRFLKVPPSTTRLVFPCM